MRKYGKDFQAIADVIGNKLEAHVRSFFVNFRRRYNLDEVLAEYELENGVHLVKEEEENGEAEKVILDSLEFVFTHLSSWQTLYTNAWCSKQVVACDEESKTIYLMHA